MTMLELLELQARARAIRSQLALEPVTKIELDSDDEDKEEETKNGKEAGTSSNENNSKNKESRNADKSKLVEKDPEKKIDRPVRRVVPPPKPTPVPSAKPVKLKRNYKSQMNDGASTSSAASQKEATPPKTVDPEKNEEKAETNDDRCSSPDVVNMDPSPETFFISDSEDDEPSTKRTANPKRKESLAEEAAESKEKEVNELPQQEDGELSDNSLRENSPEIIKQESERSSPGLSPDHSNETATNDDVVHLMSDTEIEFHHHSDNENEEIDTKPETKPEEKQESPPKQPVNRPAVQSDDDVVQINNSSDDELMNECDKSVGDSAKSTQTWEDRWLSSSKTQNILKTTQLASKVRGNIIKTKKSLKANEKKKADNEKVMKEKVSSLEEGSMEQFKVIKDNDDSSVN